MMCGTAMMMTRQDAREVVLLVTGANKVALSSSLFKQSRLSGMAQALALSKAVEEGVSHMCTCSVLQMHPNAIIACDDVRHFHSRLYIQPPHSANRMPRWSCASRHVRISLAHMMTSYMLQTVKYFKGLNQAHAELPTAERASLGVHSALLHLTSDQSAYVDANDS